MMYAFEDFELDTDSYELRRGGGVVALEPQTFEVLRLLVRNSTRVVTKEELLDEVWGSRFVSESALTTRIKQARQALGDDGRGQRLIRTVHGRGYRFVGGATGDGGQRRPSAMPVLLEREASLGAMAEALDRARGGHGGATVLVAGDAGVGKTSLVKAFAAASTGTSVLTGGCDDLMSPRALGPLRDMARLDRRLGAAFAGGGDPDAVLSAVFDLLAAGPTVLIVEDVHWADDATLDLVRLVVRRIDELPAVLVLTYREGLAPDHPLWRVLGMLRGPGVTRIGLEPLSPDAVATLAAGHQSPAALFETTRGNPFFVTEVLASPHEHVPATVRDAVLSRLAGLSAGARALLEAVSVVPSRAERWLIAAAAPDHFDSLAEAERSGMVGVGSDHIWFRHELARQAVEGALPVAVRIQLNALVLAELADRGDVEPSRVVHHAHQAGDTEALRRFASLAAAETIRLRSYRQTIDVVDVLLEHTDQLTAGELVMAHVRRAYALYVLNRLEESAACGRVAVELAERHHPTALVDALLILSRAAYWVDGPAVAAACVRQAIELLDETDPDDIRSAAYADLARAHSNLANVSIVAEPDPRVVEVARRSLELAERVDRPDLRSHALQYLGSGRMALDDPQGAADLELAVQLAEVDPRDELPVRACVNAAGSFFRAGRPDEADRFVTLGLDRASGGEFFAGQYRLELTRAGIRMAAGGWDEAGLLLHDLIGRPGDPGIMRPLAAGLLARLLARRGAGDEARAVLDGAVAAAGASDEIQLLGPIAAAAAEMAWLDGDRGIPTVVHRALDRARQVEHRSAHAEIVAWLRRAGHDIGWTGEAPGPWAAVLAGDHATAAEAWQALGERYEAALARHAAGPDGGGRGRGRGLAVLDELGASATIAALEQRS
jgi:DNA-binding winged helix-turn-helix (wHTH) protein